MHDIIQNSKRFFICACEAGGATVILSLLRGLGPKQYLFCLDGPAKDIFNEFVNENNRVYIDGIAHLNKDSDIILTGTSWSPDLERRAIDYGKKYGIITFSVLDHWTNYIERFLPQNLWKEIPPNWTDFLPNFVIVTDPYARSIADKAGFPKDRLIEIQNPLMGELNLKLKDRLGKTTLRNTNRLKILYLSEPVMDDVVKTYGSSNYWGYTEFSILQEILSFVQRNKNVLVRIRLHPNEQNEKYSSLLEGAINLQFSENIDLLDDIVWADIILGIESMALVIALLAHKPVFSYLPKSAKKECALPQKEIKHISSLNALLKVKLNPK